MKHFTPELVYYDALLLYNRNVFLWLIKKELFNSR